jgi:putative SOS response-associated peptidase YedK
MCGRYASTIPIEQMARLFRTTSPLPNCAPNWNVCPTQDAAVIRRDPEIAERHLNVLKWGLLPSWTKNPTRAHRPINSRCETIGSSGMFLTS